MLSESKKILKLYQCEYNRSIEESFASILAERGDLRLFFVNENRAFTDGVNIVVDPANDELFCDSEALRNTESFLGLPNIISKDRYMALQMVTRCQNVHEALHIIYTTFPLYCVSDSRGTDKLRKMLLSSISNIIEDAFIEAAGASEFDNMDLFLRFGRVSRLCANTPSEGTVQRRFKEFVLEKDENSKKIELIMEYLDYFITLLLYPMVRIEESNRELSEYIEKTKQFFLDGSVCGHPKARYEYTQKIFDAIEELIPEFENEEQIKPFEDMLESLLGGIKTHGTNNNSSITQFAHEGKTATITKRLLADKDGRYERPGSLISAYIKLAEEFEKDKQTVVLISNVEPKTWEYTGSELKASAIHKNIKVKVTRPKPDLNMKKAYQNIYNKYKLNINSFNAKFHQLLKGAVDTKDNKYVFGSGIASKMLGDTKKRYWYRNIRGVDVPDIAILFLIDGSGSMEGSRRDGAMVSSVILHEVLSKNNIEHAIVEHRAIFDKPWVEHNILIDFNYEPNDKYNIMLLDANNGTREGLSLMWAEKYLTENSSAENKVIVAVSDGLPYHFAGDSEYAPPVSTKDTQNAANRIYKKGIEIIAVALDDGDENVCYDELKQIYRRVVACNDIKRLPGQLLTLVSKLFS